MSAAVRQVRDSRNRGVAALRERRLYDAGVELARTLVLASQISDPGARRAEIGELAALTGHVGLHDVALLAYEELIELDQQQGSIKKAGESMVDAGNIHSDVGNEAMADRLYAAALEVLVAAQHWSIAASASTNLGARIANRGDFPEGIRRLEQSLEYLARTPFPDTEKITRIQLMQMYEHTGADLTRCVDNARHLFGRFFDAFNDQQREIAVKTVEKLIQRYCQVNPGVDCSRWRHATFPML